MARQNNSRKECYWLDVYRSWQRSGLSVRAFCRQHQVREPGFYLWRRLLRERGLIDAAPASATGQTIPPFVKIAVDQTPLPAIELILEQGRRLRVYPGFHADHLRQLLRVLEEPSGEAASC